MTDGKITEQDIQVNDDDTVMIYGIRYTGELFRALGGLGGVCDSSDLIRVLSREDDGTVTIQVWNNGVNKYIPESERG